MFFSCGVDITQPNFETFPIIGVNNQASNPLQFFHDTNNYELFFFWKILKFIAQDSKCYLNLFSFYSAILSSYVYKDHS